MQHYTKAFKAVFDILGVLDRNSITISSEFFSQEDSLQILPDQQGCLLLVLKHRSATRISVATDILLSGTETCPCWHGIPSDTLQRRLGHFGPFLVDLLSRSRRFFWILPNSFCLGSYGWKNRF